MSFYKKSMISSVVVIFISLLVAYYEGAFGSHILLQKTQFGQLAGWDQDDQAAALKAFQKSCVSILKRSPDQSYFHLTEAGNTQAWQRLCVAANQLTSVDRKSARQFFETYFMPYVVRDHWNTRGLFTGYYLPAIEGSLHKIKQASAPIYAVPSDLVKVDLGLFNKAWLDKTLVGQLKGHALRPYPDREAIQQGAIRSQGKVIAWASSRADLFFAEIQGSAIVRLPHHQCLLIGFASTNGQPYTAIGKILIKKKEIEKSKMSMQAIRDWLSSHPDQADALLNQNASYVFFRVLKEKAPLGTEQVPLTAERSLAVDTHYIPLGAPLWLETTLPNATAYHHLLVAQDVGGAIKGAVRGDIYWGEGTTAADQAGHMRQPGRYWLLLPREV